jgi:hypothetical protein
MVNYREFFDYRDGWLFWKVRRGVGIKKGSLAGTMLIDRTGKSYWRIKINGKSILAHRIIWEIFNGAIPIGLEIDHMNSVSLDNRIENLRLADRFENAKNLKIGKSNKSGLKGVYWNKKNKNWMAQITSDNRRIHLGCFITKEEAHESYCKAAKDLHGEFHRIR